MAIALGAGAFLESAFLSKRDHGFADSEARLTIPPLAEAEVPERESPSIVAETRVLPEDLSITWRKLRSAFAKRD